MYKDIARYRSHTHMHVVGSSGTGKSKFLEWLMRNDLKSGNGFCLIDWHGSLHDDVLNYLSVVHPRRPVVLVNPSHPSTIVGFNPFAIHSADIATSVARRIDATIKSWGMENTNEAPTLEKMCRLLYHFSTLTGSTLPNASLLLRQQNSHLRDYAISITSDSHIRNGWEELQAISNTKDWQARTLSTDNRLARFLFSENIRRFMCRRQDNINVFDLMQSGAIVLVNLAASDYLHREAGRVFASLLLNEFFEAAMRRAQVVSKPKPFALYLDEFAEYTTLSMASMLDQVRKGGLHMVLAHQHLGHLERAPELLQSTLTNARMRVVFGGLPFSNTELLAREMFLRRINQNQVKATNYRIAPRVRESSRIVRSHGRSSGESESDSFGMTDGFGNMEGTFTGAGDPSHSESSQFFSGSGFQSGRSTFHAITDSETVVPFTETEYVEEKVSDEFYSLQEKVSMEAERLNSQEQRECFIKMLSAEPVRYEVPFVKPLRLGESSLRRYQVEVSEAQGGLPPQEVDRLLIADEQEFLQLAKKDDVPFATRRRRS